MDLPTKVVLVPVVASLCWLVTYVFGLVYAIWLRERHHLEDAEERAATLMRPKYSLRDRHASASSGERAPSADRELPPAA